MWQLSRELADPLRPGSGRNLQSPAAWSHNFRPLGHRGVFHGWLIGSDPDLYELRGQCRCRPDRRIPSGQPRPAKLQNQLLNLSLTAPTHDVGIPPKASATITDSPPTREPWGSPHAYRGTPIQPPSSGRSASKRSRREWTVVVGAWTKSNPDV